MSKVRPQERGSVVVNVMISWVQISQSQGRSPKKSSCSFGFCPIEGGGGPCPNFLSTFHKLYILGQFGDGEGGGDPCPNFLAHWRSKKVVQVVQIGGTGG